MARTMNSKQKILESARELFYHEGFLATSVDDLIQKAGVSKSNFYYHFKSKEDLGIAVLSQRKEDFQAMLEKTLWNKELSHPERLTLFFEREAELQESRFEKGGCPLGNLIAEMAEHSERFRCMLSQMFVGLTEGITQMVREGQEAGAFRSDIDAEDAAHLIVQTMQGMHLLTKCHKSVARTVRAAHLLVQLMADY